MSAPQMESGRAFADLILDGRMDDYLDIISNACHERKRLIHIRAAAALSEGDFVKFTADAEQSFHGLHGVISDKTGKRGGSTVTVAVDTMGSVGSQFVHRGGRKKPIMHGQKWTVPAAWVERITRPEPEPETPDQGEYIDSTLTEIES